MQLLASDSEIVHLASCILIFALAYTFRHGIKALGDRLMDRFLPRHNMFGSFIGEPMDFPGFFDDLPLQDPAFANFARATDVV